MNFRDETETHIMYALKLRKSQGNYVMYPIWRKSLTCTLVK